MQMNIYVHPSGLYKAKTCKFYEVFKFGTLLFYIRLMYFEALVSQNNSFYFHHES